MAISLRAARSRGPAMLGLAGGSSLVLALVGCSGAGTGAEPEQKADGTKTEAAATPGTATCDFSGDGPKTATITETADAYEVTFTGDFITPETMQPKEGRTTFGVSLWDPENGDSTALIFQYERGTLAQSGFQEEAEITPLKTEVKLEDGAFTAKYPKPIPSLEQTPPTTWTPSLYVDDGTGGQPETYRCGDGRTQPFTPLGK
ncbi:hypothetical protein JD292_09390 [Leucobacter sp. CSA2]|uniref:Lipoprotein n=1 Tax=Leucobacter edaphi TaxID=2796472 RepID=A0A934UXQ0_9MICO|nr:hypothetical protein [Leucobacter edaphi]MBK0422285.1 hypothetical protein [Leucobacter edaphi]